MKTTRPLLRLATVIGIASLFYLGFVVGNTWLAPRRATSPLAIDAADLRFGETWAVPSFQWRVPVRNVSEDPVEVSNVAVSCTCTSVEPKRFTLKPGEAIDLKFVLDLRPRNTTAPAKNVSEFDVSFRLHTRQGPVQHAPVWKISGEVKTPLVMEPAEIAYSGSKRLIKGTPFPSAHVIIKPMSSGFELSAHCDPKLGEVFLTRDDDSEDAPYELEFVPASRLPAGPFSGTVQLMNRVDGKLHEVAGVTVEGAVVGPAVVFPEMVYVGALPLGSSATAELHVDAPEDRPFELGVAQREIGAGSVEIEGDPLAARRRLRLEVIAMKAGSRADTLAVTLKFHDGEIQELKVPIHYYGLPAAAAE